MKIMRSVFSQDFSSSGVMGGDIYVAEIRHFVEAEHYSGSNVVVMSESLARHFSQFLNMVNEMSSW